MNRVQEIRVRRGVELETLAERVGVSARFLRSLEADASPASVDVAFRLADALRTPIDELFIVDSKAGRRIVFGRERPASAFESPQTGKVAQTSEVAEVAPLPDPPQTSAVAEIAPVPDPPQTSVVAENAPLPDPPQTSSVAENAPVPDPSRIAAVAENTPVPDPPQTSVVAEVAPLPDPPRIAAVAEIAPVPDPPQTSVVAENAPLPDPPQTSAVAENAPVPDPPQIADSAPSADSSRLATLFDFPETSESPELAEIAETTATADSSAPSESPSPLRRVRSRTIAPTEAELKKIEPKRTVPKKAESRRAAPRIATEEGIAANPIGLADPTVGRPIRYFDLFCGIGGFRFAAERTFAKMRRDAVCSLSCDSDAPAQASYLANFGDKPVGDVAELPSEAIPDFDLLFAGFPCQAFSIIGLRKGFADETKGSLFFQIARILRDKRPRAFVLENVKQLTTHDGGRTFQTIIRILTEELNYNVDWRIMNALDCGLPQKRERVTIVGSSEPFEIAWPKKKTDGVKTLADVLENDADVDPKHFASPEIVARRKAAHTPECRPAIWHENKSGNVSSYPYSCALRAGASYNYLLVDGVRRLTPRECLRLQGFPDSFKTVVSDAQIRKQAGNAAPVDLIERVLDRFLPLVFETGKDADVK